MKGAAKYNQISLVKIQNYGNLCIYYLHTFRHVSPKSQKFMKLHAFWKNWSLFHSSMALVQKWSKPYLFLDKLLCRSIYQELLLINFKDLNNALSFCKRIKIESKIWSYLAVSCRICIPFDSSNAATILFIFDLGTILLVAYDNSFS